MKLFSAITFELETLQSLLSRKKRMSYVVGFSNTGFEIDICW